MSSDTDFTSTPEVAFHEQQVAPGVVRIGIVFVNAYLGYGGRIVMGFGR